MNQERTLKKISRYLMPFLFLLYLISYVDRGNVSYAALEMNKELGITSTAFGFLSGIFYLGYVLFEVPSNILLSRFGARKWIARILITWGIAVVISTWVQNVNQMYVMRFLLGVAEAGFYPGVLLYLTFWFPQKEYAKNTAFFIAALPVANIVGAPISTWIIDHVHWLGIPGWRWLFFLEGIPAVVFGFITLFVLVDGPEKAKWLTQEEKKWLFSEMQKEQQIKGQDESHTTLKILSIPKIWLFGLIFFCLAVGNVGIGSWMPTIIKSFSKGLTNTQVGLIAMIPYIAGAVAMLVWSRHSDKTGERKLHSAIPPLVGSLALIVAGLVANPVVRMTAMTIAVVGVTCFYAPFWSLSRQYLSKKAAVVGLAAITTIGNTGGFFGPYMIGYLKDLTGSTNAGLIFISLSLFLCFVLLTTLSRPKVTSLEANQLEEKSI
jgi:MFS transporter, ACS family, tartrate transporter